MAFALVVEDGSGVDGANSYCSIADADTFHESQLHSEKWNTTDDEKARALALATRLLDRHLAWQGSRVVTTRETPAWPRLAMYDIGGLLIDSDTIPQVLKDATAEFALRLIEKDRVRDAEDPAISVSAGRGSKGYSAGRSVPVVPPSVVDALAHFILPSRLVLSA